MEKTPCKNVVSPHNCEYHWSEKIPFMSHSIMPDRVSTALGNGWFLFTKHGISSYKTLPRIMPAGEGLVEK